jgi:5,10-methenyltetrahydrofolate synthetase
LRQEALVRRAGQSAEVIAAWSAELVTRLLLQWKTPPGQVIGFCWPVRNEADLRPLLARWRRAEPESALVTALPVVVDRHQALAFRPWQPGAAMVTDAYGIPTPAEGDFVQPDVLLIPLNAFDGKGFRIGYGAGFFDRTLASLRPRPLAIGVGFEIGRVADTLPQPHDERLDWIATEAGIWPV